MMEVDAYKLENEQFYNQIGDIEYNGLKYLLLSNENDPKDICIRKLKKQDADEYICQLDKQEFKIVMNLFMQKYQSVLNREN